MMQLKDIDWGDDSAEKDKNLLDYFVSSEAFQRLAEKRKTLVIGRKGSGKSALLRKLYDHFSGQENTFIVRLSPKFNAIRSILNDSDLITKFGEEIFFHHTWLRQIYLDFLCACGHKLKGSFLSGSKAFARDVSQQLDRTSKDFVENISETLSKIKIKAADLGELGLHIERELRDVADLDTLQHHLVQLAEEGQHFVILIDDLDLGWNNSKVANNLLLGLLTASNYISSLHRSLHPIVFLREDVYTILLSHTQHSDKFRDVERIRWTQDQLIAILEARIEFNLQQYGASIPSNLFYSVFPRTIGTANTDNWMIERTLSRPRELIQLARYYSESLPGDKPSDDKLKDAEPAYSSWKLDDLCAEYSNQYPGLVSVMAYWKTIFFRRKYHLKRTEIDELLVDILANVTLDTDWFNSLVKDTDTLGFLNVLYEIGLLGDFVLGGEGGSKTYYSFQEFHQPIFDEIQVHPCFRRALNTVERIRSR